MSNNGKVLRIPSQVPLIDPRQDRRTLPIPCPAQGPHLRRDENENWRVCPICNGNGIVRIDPETIERVSFTSQDKKEESGP